MIAKSCGKIGCDRSEYKDRLCQEHFRRVQLNLDTPTAPQYQWYKHKGPCSIVDCDVPARCKAMCDSHYRRLLHGRIHLNEVPVFRRVTYPKGKGFQHAQNVLVKPRSRKQPRCFMCRIPAKVGAYQCGYCGHVGDTRTEPVGGLAVEVRVTCNIEDCKRPSVARGLCKMHYQRNRRANQTDLVINQRRAGTWGSLTAPVAI